MTITNSTISGNSATSVIAGTGDTGGISNSSNGTVNVKNSIIAGNSDTGADNIPDLSGTFTSGAYNLIGNNHFATITPTTGDQIGTPAAPINPKLGPLQNNVGPTFTHALLPGSPAIDKGSAATDPVTGNPITTNQRGFKRPVDNPAIMNATGGDGSDIGAFEQQMLTAGPGASTAIPGGVGNFTSVSAPSLSGALAFFGAGPGGQQGIYVALPSGPLRVADKNTAIPNGAGNFTDFTVNGQPSGPPSISGSNVAFFGMGAGGQQGIYVAVPDGPPSRVADQNTAIPNGTGNFTDFTVNGQPSGPPEISGSNVAFFGMGARGQQGIYVAIPNGPPDKVADTNTSIPGGVGHFTGFMPSGPPIAPAINGQNVAFFGTGSGGQQGIYVSIPAGPPEKVADTNTAIPGGIGNFTGFSPVSMSETDVTFLGTGSGGQIGLYDLTGGTLVKVVDMNTMIEGKTITGLLFASTGLTGDLHRDLQ